MPEINFIPSFRKSKIVQLCILILIEAAFVFVLISNPLLCKQVFTNQYLFTLCLFTWILMIFNQITLIYDLVKLRNVSLESNTLKQNAYFDGLSGLLNRNGLDKYFENYQTPQSLENVGLFMATIDNLRQTNLSEGHAAGDVLIQNFSHMLESAGEGFGVVGRNCSNVFILIANDCEERNMEQFVSALMSQIDKYNEMFPATPVLIQHTYLINTDKQFETIGSLLTATYNKLFDTQ